MSRLSGDMHNVNRKFKVARILYTGTTRTIRICRYVEFTNRNDQNCTNTQIQTELYKNYHNGKSYIQDCTKYADTNRNTNSVVTMVNRTFKIKSASR